MNKINPVLVLPLDGTYYRGVFVDGNEIKRRGSDLGDFLFEDRVQEDLVRFGRIIELEVRRKTMLGIDPEGEHPPHQNFWVDLFRSLLESAEVNASQVRLPYYSLENIGFGNIWQTTIPPEGLYFARGLLLTYKLKRADRQLSLF